MNQHEPEQPFDGSSPSRDEQHQDHSLLLSMHFSARSNGFRRFRCSGGLYRRDGSATYQRTLMPLETAINQRRAVSTFRGNEMVLLKPRTEADLILCLPLEAELDVDPEDIAAIVEVLLQDNVVAIYAANALAPSAVFEIHIRPTLVDLISNQMRKDHWLKTRTSYITVVK